METGGPNPADDRDWSSRKASWYENTTMIK